jgi:diguanylate cyclase
MISLRKHIDSYHDSLSESSLAAFRSALLAISECGQRAVPDLGRELNRKFADIQQMLAAPVTPSLLTQTSERAESELSEWADCAYQQYTDNQREIREIIGVVGWAAESVAERDEKYASEIGELHGRLRSIAKLDDVALIRRSILDNTKALKACVDQMVEDSRQSLQTFLAEIAEYRARLVESERISSTDALTELANRRAFERALEAKIVLKQTFCLVMIDLNDFKVVNDRFGHLAGDDLLRQFGRKLRAQFTPADFVGRWGGDEFVGIVAGVQAEARARVAGIKKYALGEYEIKAGSETFKIPLEASIGAVEWDGIEAGVTLLARADKHVYVGKERRRNSSIHFAK